MYLGLFPDEYIFGKTRVGNEERHSRMFGIVLAITARCTEGDGEETHAEIHFNGIPTAVLDLPDTGAEAPHYSLNQSGGKRRRRSFHPSLRESITSLYRRSSPSQLYPYLLPKLLHTNISFVRNFITETIINEVQQSCETFPMNTN